MTKRLEQRSSGIPVLLPCVAAVAGFRALGVRRIALYHPPWFTDDTVDRGREYFQRQGFEVTYASHLLPARQQIEIYPAEVYEWVRSHAPSNLEGIFIGGNGFRALGVIAALEADLGRPVLTANQVSLWYALHLAGVGAAVEGYGQVFKATLDRK